jgi:hypothetical protein
MAINLPPVSAYADDLAVTGISDVHLNLLPLLWNSTMNMATDQSTNVSISCKDGHRLNVTRDQEVAWSRITCGRCNVDLPAYSGVQFAEQNFTLPTAAVTAATASGGSRQRHLVHATLVIYTAVFLFGFVGNSLVIVVILK